MSHNDIIYDIETYPNVFTFSAEHAFLPIQWVFEISPRRNDSRLLVEYLRWFSANGVRLVGYNNLGFDYPVIHMLMKMGECDARTLYDKAMSIIASQDGLDRWRHNVKPSDRHVEQIDLFKIHHFDNIARATSLKVLEFNMRSDNIEDLPFPVGTELTPEQIPVLLHYNMHDVRETKKFYHHTTEMIEFREELTQKYSRDFMNHNDTKIGKDFFQMKLEEAGVQTYVYGPNGREPNQTKRPVIQLKDAILPSVIFNHPELQRVLTWLKAQTITETKGVFKNLTASVEGFEFVFGLGGIHGSIDSEVVGSDEEWIVEDWDVASYYPNLAIANGLYPAHLGQVFCTIYKNLYEQRKSFPKGTVENAMLKLALNGVYGDSNNKHSIFYDPLFTMSITLNGQLLLCMLAETLMRENELRMIQVNTDGLTIRYPRYLKDWVHSVCDQWEQSTSLTLESVEYEAMFIRDVNNYIAQTNKGDIKLKGAYDYNRDWSQNHSALIVPKVAEQHLINGKPIRATVENWPDIMDFMLRTKVPRTSRLVIHNGDSVTQLQNTTRYYISKSGGQLFKIMPPTPKMRSEGKMDERKIGIESGWFVTPMNNMDRYESLDIDYEYYIQQVEKLCLGLQ